MLVGRLFDSTIRDVSVELRLINGVDGAQAHRDRWKLPKIRHETRVRVRRESAGEVRFFLTETVQLVFRQAPFEERTRIHARSSVPLVEDLVSTARVIRTSEKVIVSNLVERGTRCVGANVPANANSWSLRAMNHHS